MRKLKLLIITHEFPPNVTSGSGVHISELVDELVKSGNEVTVVTTNEDVSKEYEKKGGLEIYRIKIAQSGILDRIIPNLLDHRIMLSLKMRRFIKRLPLEQFDLMHINDSKISYFLNKDIVKMIPVIISVNDYYAYETSWNIFRMPYYSTDFIIRYFYYNLIRILDTRFLRYASLVMTNSKYTASSINRFCSIPKDKIAVVYRGLDLSQFRYRPGKDKYHNHRILFIGKNMERKGAVDVVRAFFLISKRFPDSTLTLVGRAGILYRRKVDKLAKKSALEARIRIIRQIEHDKIIGLMQESNVFVFPPLIENLARTLYEAQASMTPVVTTDVGANPEGVSHETSMIVKPKRPEQIADAVISIFSDQKKARSMGINGFKRVEKLFNKKIMFDKTVEQYRRVARHE